MEIVEAAGKRPDRTKSTVGESGRIWREECGEKKKMSLCLASTELEVNTESVFAVATKPRGEKLTCEAEKKGLFLASFSRRFFTLEDTTGLSIKTNLVCLRDAETTRRGQKQTQLQTDRDNGVYRWHLLCLLFLFLSAFFHLAAKIKAYNQILLIGPDRGDYPASLLPPSRPAPLPSPAECSE